MERLTFITFLESEKKRATLKFQTRLDAQLAGSHWSLHRLTIFRMSQRSVHHHHRAQHLHGWAVPPRCSQRPTCPPLCCTAWPQTTTQDIGTTWNGPSVQLMSRQCSWKSPTHTHTHTLHIPPLNIPLVQKSNKEQTTKKLCVPVKLFESEIALHLKCLTH